MSASNFTAWKARCCSEVPLSAMTVSVEVLIAFPVRNVEVEQGISYMQEPVAEDFSTKPIVE